MLETIVDGQTRYRKAEETRVARGTQHRKRRTGPNARKPATAPSVAATRKQRPPEWQEQLFFQRLRVHAKWAFVLLALVFGLGFVFLGIGSGSNGITDALQNAFNFGKSSGGTSISSLESKTQKHPLDAKAWRDLATAYETKQRTNDAIIALAQYIGAAPQGRRRARRARDRSTASRRTSTRRTTRRPSRPPPSRRPPFAAFPPAVDVAVRQGAQRPERAAGPDLGVAVARRLRPRSRRRSRTTRRRRRNAEDAYKKLAKLTPKDPNAQYPARPGAQTPPATRRSRSRRTRRAQARPGDDGSAAGQATRSALKALTPAAEK